MSSKCTTGVVRRRVLENSSVHWQPFQSLPIPSSCSSPLRYEPRALDTAHGFPPSCQCIAAGATGNDCECTGTECGRKGQLAHQVGTLRYLCRTNSPNAFAPPRTEI